jgi:polyketide cyclase/dehydrase/lipid transport protein
MAHNEIRIEVAPERVFAVLSEPRSFARWVVGSREVRRADSDWPAVGSVFDHTIGIWPMVLSDHSEVVECEAPGLLKLLVKARPFSRAYVTLRLHAAGTGTQVMMDEVAADTRSRLVFNPLTDPLVRLRNNISLRRLKALSEGSEAIPTGYLPTRASGVEGHVTGSSAPVKD